MRPKQRIRFQATGELGEKTHSEYDDLDRLKARLEPDLKSYWVFDTATYGKGKLAEAYTLSGTVKDYRRVHTYDAIGRPGKTTQTLTDGTYTSTQGYDAWGRVISQTYQRNTDPAKQFDSRYHNGYLARIERGSLVLWKVNAQDAGNRPTSVALGNGLTQSRDFNRHMAQMTSGALSTAGNVARLQEGYDYDPLNNVVWRQQFWDQGGFQESFTYDALNRLETGTVQGRTAQTFRYDAAGNLLSKTGVGTGNYTYPAQGATAVRPHAVQSIPGIGSFVYDDNGNLTSGNGRTMSWTSFDMPLTITGGGMSATFVYGPEHQRIRQTRGDGSSVVYAGSQEVEKNASGTTVKTYWPGGIGVEIDRPGATVSELYWHHLDRLGSVIGLTDQQGVLKEKLGYDAWGKRRTIDGASTPNNLDGQVDNRGFTGHEMLDQLDLVHMNGRVYDPLVARFVSGDPLIQDPVDGQNYNRYSYVLNNPTNNTDPTGFECETMTGSRVCGNITSAACSGNCNSGLVEVDPGANKDVRREKKQDGKTNAKDGGNTTAHQQEPQSANNGTPNTLTPGQQAFLENSVACYPACALPLGYATGAAAGAAGAPGVWGAQDERHRTGDPEIDAFEKSTKAGPAEWLAAAWNQLERLVRKSSNSGPNEYQYALLARADGVYPDVRGGTVTLKMGDVWKFGTSVDPSSRYPRGALDALNLSMVRQTQGTRYQVLAQEKLNLIGYYINHGRLPPGNKVFK